MPALIRALPLTLAACSEPVLPAWCDPPASAPATAARELVLDEGAAWCTLPDETRDAAADRASKARVVVAGEVVPVGAGPVPACVVRDPAAAGLVAVGDALWQVTDVPGVAWAATAVQALAGRDGGAATLTLRVQAPEGLDALALDGAHHRYDDDVAVGWVLDVGGERRGLAACEMPDEPRSRHRVRFDGGEVTFELRVAESLLGTQPSVLERAEGLLGDTAFATADAWSLGYGPTHHHVDRSFHVTLPGVVDGVSAIDVRHADPERAAPPAEVRLLDGAGRVMARPTVIEEQHEALPP